MRWLRRIFLFLVVLVVVYFVGPTPTKPRYPIVLPGVASTDNLDEFIRNKENKHRVKPGNEAQIVWANQNSPGKTAYAMVYLHGFTASHEEGNPVHKNLAKKFGCNLFLSRLSQHGIDTTEQLLNLTPENYWESAREALAIGKQLGEKVILVGTSTGATQALQLAAAFPNDVAALALYSPNIEINDNNAWLLNDPWGLQIARLVKGSKYNDPEDNRDIYKRFWNKPYRLEALVSLQHMLESTMNEQTFRKVKQPVLLLYYYKDEENQDKVVRVSAMQEMFKQLGTPAALKKELALPTTGNHVIASPIKSADVNVVEVSTSLFFTEILQMKAVE